jgi:hypothetical protein
MAILALPRGSATQVVAGAETMHCAPVQSSPDRIYQPFKDLAGELGLSLIALSQLERESPRPGAPAAVRERLAHEMSRSR